LTYAARSKQGRKRPADLPQLVKVGVIHSPRLVVNRNQRKNAVREVLGIGRLGGETETQGSETCPNSFGKRCISVLHMKILVKRRVNGAKSEDIVLRPLRGVGVNPRTGLAIQNFRKCFNFGEDKF
jgi:hypothetical protein